MALVLVFSLAAVLISASPVMAATIDRSSPANGAHVPGTSVTFQWTAAEGATDYYLLVKTNDVFAAISEETHYFSGVPGEGNALNKTVGGFPNDGTTYYWWVWSDTCNINEVLGNGPWRFTNSPEEPGGCFIATAAYGTSTAAEIDTLRAFRDEVLLQNSLGSHFVDFYYEVSPPVADFISEHEGLRTLVRELLVDPVVWVVDTIETLWRD